MAEFLNRDRIFIEKLTGIILANISKESFGVQELAEKAGITRNRLNRRLLSAVNKTAHRFIRDIRLRKALEMLKNEDLTAAEVAYRTGFSSPAYFNSSFHEFFGYPPGKVNKITIEYPENELNINEVPDQVLDYTSGRKPVNFRYWRLSIIVLIAIGAIIVYLKTDRSDSLKNLKSPDGRLSVAVMPFKNMTNDPTWNTWQYLIQENLISSLANNPAEISVRQSDPINNLLKNRDITTYAIFTPGIARKVSRKLDARIFIYGNIQRAGDNLRLSAQVINSKTEEVLKSIEIDWEYKPEEMIKIIDSMRNTIRSFLLIARMKEEIPADYQRYDYTFSPEAYRLFIDGNEAVWNGETATAIKLYRETLKIDSNFFAAKIFMTSNTMFQGNYKDAKKLCLELYEQRDHIPWIYRNNVNWIYACLFETPIEAIKYLQEDLKSYGDWSVVHYLIGEEYCKLTRYEKAIPEFEKALELKKDWNEKPVCSNYILLGWTYHETGQYKKERKLYKEAIEYFPDELSLIYRMAILALTTGDTVGAGNYVRKFVTLCSEKGMTEAELSTRLAILYSEAGIMDKVEESYLKALSLEPENPARLNNIAYFLIDKDRNINLGMKYIDRALKIEPDNYSLLHTKGWGLFKQQKYEDARATLIKSWNLRKEDGLYSHTEWVHLETVKKAVAEHTGN